MATPSYRPSSPHPRVAIGTTRRRCPCRPASSVRDSRARWRPVRRTAAGPIRTATASRRCGSSAWRWLWLRAVGPVRPALGACGCGAAVPGWPGMPVLGWGRRDCAPAGSQPAVGVLGLFREILIVRRDGFRRWLFGGRRLGAALSGICGIVRRSSGRSGGVPVADRYQHAPLAPSPGGPAPVPTSRRCCTRLTQRLPADPTGSSDGVVYQHVRWWCALDGQTM